MRINMEEADPSLAIISPRAGDGTRTQAQGRAVYIAYMPIELALVAAAAPYWFRLTIEHFFTVWTLLSAGATAATETRPPL